MLQPIDSSFNRAIVAMSDSVFPNGFDVSERAPSSLADLLTHVSLTGRMLVWSGASDRTIYADSSVNWAMRAWHDSCHISGLHDFTIAGESAACEVQLDQLARAFPRAPRLWSRLIWLEVIGQALHADQTGQFVTDQVNWTRARI
jgi:hypothetical protein